MEQLESRGRSGEDAGQRRAGPGQRTGTDSPAGMPTGEGDLVRGEERSGGGHTQGGQSEQQRPSGMHGRSGGTTLGDPERRDFGDTQFGEQRGQEQFQPRERYKGRQGSGMQDPADPRLPQWSGDEE